MVETLLLIGLGLVVSIVVRLAYALVSLLRVGASRERIRERYEADKVQTKQTDLKENVGHNLVYLAAIAGASLVAVTQLLQIRELDAYLTISLCAFGVAIPVLAGEIVLQRQTSSFYEYTALPDITLLGQLGLLSGTVGLAGLFFHFTVVAGMLFAFGSGLAWGSLSFWLHVTKVVNEEDADEEVEEH